MTPVPGEMIIDPESSYDEKFYAAFVESSTASARVIVPEILALLGSESVIDVGCGEGIWLSVFAEHGVRRVFGIDGDHVRRERLRISPFQFAAHDLSRPFELAESFSLVLSLEVAEHLPPASAAGFVRSLAALGKVVLFSAAVPFQTGRHHVNLQWQDYWVELFAAQGYLAVDAIRPLIWQNESVTFWYRQNMILFVDETYLPTQPVLVRARERTRSAQLSIAHPYFLTLVGRTISADQLNRLHLSQVLPYLPRMVMRAAGRILRGFGRDRNDTSRT